MNYVVVDLEWNQAMSSKSSVFNKLPIHLGGEIIEIGAVKLKEDMTPGEEFTIDVKPVYFRRMHYKVKKITGFDKERLAHGIAFADALEQFRAWCGDGVTFITWGNDDQRIMEQNIIIHDLDWDWIGGWINLQLIYNLQTGGDKNQKSLASAMEHFEIERPASRMTLWATRITPRSSPPGSIWPMGSACTRTLRASSPRACQTSSPLSRTRGRTHSAMRASRA